MKIKTTVTEERDIDVKLPFFRKQDNNYGILKYLAVLDEKTVITIFNGAGRIAVTLDDQDSNIANAYISWLPVSEKEFMDVHELALNSMTLTPQLSELEKEIMQEMKDHDDIKDVL